MNYFDSDMSKSTNKVVYIDWKRVIYIYACGKCRTQLKKKETSFKNRQLLTKFRISDHSLKKEIGRYRNIPKKQRLCDNCIGIDNEHHLQKK
jgi:hypothetical protein